MLRSSSASLARLSRYTPLRSRWGAFAFVACALVAQASPAEAFCRNTTCKDTDKKTCLKDDKGCTTEGNALFWPTSCIEFHMNEQGTQFLDLRETRTAIMKAFRSWSAVDCGGGKQAIFHALRAVAVEVHVDRVVAGHDAAQGGDDGIALGERLAIRLRRRAKPKRGCVAWAGADMRPPARVNRPVCSTAAATTPPASHRFTRFMPM